MKPNTIKRMASVRAVLRQGFDAKDNASWHEFVETQGVKSTLQHDKKLWIGTEYTMKYLNEEEGKKAASLGKLLLQERDCYKKDSGPW